MIPAGLLLWLVIWAARRAQKGNSPPPGRANELGGVETLKVLAYACVGIAIFPIAVVVSPSPLLALAGTAWLMSIGPHWLAWRVCHPLGLRRTGHLLLYLAVHLNERQRNGRLRFFGVSLGRPFRPPPPKADTTLDPWTACAAVIEAERRGNAREASMLQDGLLAVRLGAAFPPSVRRRPVELLARAAADRGDWPETARRASLGRGRATRLLRLVARAHLLGDVPRVLLWCAWLMAPRRIASFAMVRGAARAGRPARVPRGLPLEAGPWLAHMEMLGRAAGGRPLELAHVFALAESWDIALGPAEEARFRARALELGSTRSLETAVHLREAIVGDLSIGARGAGGALPAHELGGIARELADRVFDDCFEAVDTLSRDRRAAKAAGLGHLLEEWRSWLELRSATETLATRLGDQSLREAWYAGARLAAWNWPCQLLEVYGERAAWACLVMFRWTTEMARRCGDDEAAQVNERNVRIAFERTRVA